MNILVVEDEPLILMDIEVLLQDAGYQVFAAPNAAIALQTLDRHAIDMLLSDIDIPGPMNGIGLAKVVGTERPHVQIVLMSGNKPPAPHDLPKRAKFLPKPLRITELLQAVWPPEQASA